MKRTSYPRAVSRSLTLAALVSITMAALLFAAMQHAQTLRERRLLDQLPRTARALLRIDTAALERTTAAKTLLDAFVADEELSEIEAVCGLDPIQALSEISVWVRGPDDQPFQSIGLMLRGRGVDATTLADCHRALVEGRGGSIVRLDGPAGPWLASRDQRSAIAVLDGHAVITGSVKTVAEALAVQRGTAPALVERHGVAALWPAVSSASSIAAVLEPPDHWVSALGRVPQLLDMPLATEAVQTLGLSVESGSAQTVKLYIDFSDAQVASRDAERIKTWCATRPQSVEPPWRKVLKSARVHAHERTIEVTLDVSSLSAAR